MNVEYRTKTGKQKLALELITQVDILYARATANEQNSMSYHDACKITDYVQTVFREQTEDVPKLVEGACALARGLLNPNKVKQGQDLSRGLGLLLTTAGGIGLVFGLLTALGVGLGIWAHVWAIIAGTTGHITGGITIVLATTMIVAGIYVAVAVQTPQTLSGKVHQVLVDAINSWADVEKAKASDARAKKAIRAQQEGAPVAKS